METGARVKVVRGRRDVGTAGVVFWVGTNRYGPGQRLGIHADDGRTLWIDAAHVALFDHSAPEETESDIAADLRQVRETIAAEAGHPVRLVAWEGEAPTSSPHADAKRAWVEDGANRLTLPPDFGPVRGADAANELVLLCSDWRIAEASPTTGVVRERPHPAPKERLLDVAFVEQALWAVLTVERLYLLSAEGAILDSFVSKRDAVEAVFGGRGLVVYGDYGTPMLFGISHGRLTRLGSTHARVDRGREQDGHLIFESHGQFFELWGAASAIEACERRTPRKHHRDADATPPVVEEALPEPPPPTVVLSPWSLDDETSRFPGHALLGRSASGRLVAVWDPRADLRGDLPRRTELGFSDAPDHLVDLSDVVKDHVERNVTELGVDPSGRWLFFQGRHTLKRLDLEAHEVEHVHPRVEGFHVRSGDCVVLCPEGALIWLERQANGWHEAARARVGKARSTAYSSELDCLFVLGASATKTQAFARIGARVLRVWTSKTPFIRAAFAGDRVFLYRHAGSVSELSGFAALVESQRRLASQKPSGRQRRRAPRDGS